MIEFRTNTQNFSGPTKELDAAMRGHRIARRAIPCWFDARATSWSLQRMVERVPRKARPEQKIDATLARIMAIARCMAAKPARSAYESRGIQFVG